MLQLPKNEYRISITSGCNMKCVYCHNEGNHVINQLSKDDVENLIKSSYDLGLEQVRITGGEPLIHKEIFDICAELGIDEFQGFYLSEPVANFLENSRIPEKI